MVGLPKRLLWPTDFSKLSIKAAEVAKAYADAFGAEVHVLNLCLPVVPAPEAYLPLTQMGVTQVPLAGDAEKELKRLVAEVFCERAMPKCSVVTGMPWMAIWDYAERNEIDLIIMATRGLTGIKHALIGSTAERVVRHAGCAVMTVK